MIKRRFLKFTLSVLICANFLHNRASGVEYSVTNNNGSGTGSLRQAIDDINAAGSSVETNTIVFQQGGTIMLNNVLPVTKPIAFDMRGNSVSVEWSSGHQHTSLFGLSGAVATINLPETLSIDTESLKYTSGVQGITNLYVTGNLAGSVFAHNHTGGWVYGLYATDGALSIGGDLSGRVSAATDDVVAYGLYANKGNLAIGGNLTGSVSATSGTTFAYGLYAYKGELSIAGNLSGTVSATAGTLGATGLYARDQSLFIGGNLSGTVSAVANGGLAYGLYATRGASIVNSSDLTIGGNLSGTVSATTHGMIAYGLYANRGTLALAGDLSGTVSAHADGSLAAGLYSYNGAISIGGSLSGTVIASSDDVCAAGLKSENGAIYGALPTLPLTISGTVSAEANGEAAAILSTNGMNLNITGTVSGNDNTNSGLGYALRSGSFNVYDGGYNESIDVTDLVTVAAQGVLIGKVDLGKGNDSMTLSDQATISGVPVLNGGDGTDTLLFEGWHGSLYGVNVLNWESIGLNSGSTVNLGASTIALNPKTIAFTTLTIDATSTLLAAGSSPGYYNLPGNINNNGTISLLDNQDTGDRLTITGNYGGNGVMTFDVNTSTAAADQVTITGNATGTTRVMLHELGIPANPSAPILLIHVVGTQDPAFFIPGEYIYPYGPKLYSYTISADAGDYFLTSLFLDHYREEAALLQGVLPFVERTGFEAVTGFRERQAYHVGACGDHDSSAYWVRAYGSSFGIGQEGDAATSISGYSGGTQVGGDFAAGGSGNSSQYHIGVYAGSAWQKADVAGILTPKAGELSQQVYSVGLYASLECPKSYFLEAVAQSGYHSLDIISPDELDPIKTNIWSFVSSLEGGITVPVNNTFLLEPQIQCIYQHTGNMPLATVIGDATVDSHEGLRTRLGLNGTFTKSGTPFNPFFEINMIKDFTNDSTVRYAADGSILSSKPETTYLGGSIGIATAKARKDAFACYAKVGVFYGLDSKDSYNYLLMAGIRNVF